MTSESRHPLARQICHPAAGQRFRLDGETYTLGGRIGDGAVGLVRKATRLRDGKLFALKILAPDPKYIEESAFDDVASRFKREGERGARLDHDSLVKVVGYADNEGGVLFEGHAVRNPILLMPFMSGRTLESYIRHLPVMQRRALHVTRDKLAIAAHVANALEYLHGRKLVHRDVKPANIFLAGGPSERTAVLGDFGVVKWGDFHASMSTGTLTATNQAGLGTLKYMSPEQAVRPKEVSVRSDIYSFGITLFELFTGQILASPHHVFEVMNARLLRGTTAGRFAAMDCALAPTDEDLGATLLDMHLRGQEGRPAIATVRGKLEYLLESMDEEPNR